MQPASVSHLVGINHPPPPKTHFFFLLLQSSEKFTEEKTRVSIFIPCSEGYLKRHKLAALHPNYDSNLFILNKDWPLLS